jgi:DNA polymerase-4
LELADQVARRMRRYQIVGKTIQLKLRFSDFRTITRSHTIPERTHSTQVIGENATRLLLDNLPPDPANDPTFNGIRLLGVGVSHLRTAGIKQQTLFDREEQQKSNRLDHATDEICEKFGVGSLQRATSIHHEVRHRRLPTVDEDGDIDRGQK